MQSVSVVETISWLHAFVVQYDPELHQQADTPESPLKAEQTPVELPVYAEHEEIGVTQPQVEQEKHKELIKDLREVCLK